jgi:hypothetical protein
VVGGRVGSVPCDRELWTKYLSKWPAMRVISVFDIIQINIIGMKGIKGPLSVISIAYVFSLSYLTATLS